MGMYTEIFVNTDLKRETPDEVIDVIRAIVDRRYCNPALEGRPDRWVMLFGDGSYYTPRTSCASLTYDEISRCWSLIGKGDIKNYKNEIEAFFDFIKPWCESDFIGYMRYEEDREPTLIFSRNNEEE